VVKVGQIVKVKVLEVDEKRKRIALTMRMSDTAAQTIKANEPRDANDGKRLAQHKQSKPAPSSSANNAMAAAFAKLKS
jgi:uncharacterized protein